MAPARFAPGAVAFILPAMLTRGTTPDRRQMLRALPQHVLWAVVLGAVAGPLLWWLLQIPMPDGWQWLLAIPAGAVFANAAVLPVALPGRHWSFAFIGAMMLFLLLVAGMILARTFAFPHSQLPALPPHGTEPLYVPEVNYVTWVAVLTGGCLGLLYGLLAGRSGGMSIGLAIGSATGYLLGIASLQLVSSAPCPWGCGQYHDVFWRFDGPLHLAWQCALLLAVLHLGACLGAALGAGANPQTGISNPISG